MSLYFSNNRYLELIWVKWFPNPKVCFFVSVVSCPVLDHFADIETNPWSLKDCKIYAYYQHIRPLKKGDTRMNRSMPSVTRGLVFLLIGRKDLPIKASATFASRWPEIVGYRLVAAGVDYVFNIGPHWPKNGIPQSHCSPIKYTMYLRCVLIPFWTCCRPDTHGHRSMAGPLR